MRSLRPKGFTLIESALTTVIVGFGVSAVMALLGVCTQQNSTGGKMTVAMMLAGNVQETMANLPFNDPIRGRSTFGPDSGETLGTYNDLDDFDGSVFCPPIDSLRTAVATLGQYTQTVSVTPVDPNRLSTDLPKTISNWLAVRVVVQVSFKPTPAAVAQDVYRTSWVRMYR